MTYYQNYDLRLSKNSIWLYKTPLYSTIENLNYIQEFGFFNTKFGYYTQRNNLRSYLILVTTEGRGVLEYENRNYEITPNSVIFIDCNRYQFYKCTTNNWKFYFIHFNGTSIKYCFKKYSNDKNVILFNRFLTTDLVNQIKKLINLDKYKNNNEFIISATISDIIANVLTVKLENKLQTIPQSIEQIKKFLDNNYTQKITLATIINNFYVSRSFIDKKFKFYYGITPIQYLNYVRIDKAKYYLRNSSLPMTKIAELVGINDCSYFNKLFKKNLDITPQKYRKNWKNCD